MMTKSEYYIGLAEYTAQGTCEKCWFSKNDCCYMQCKESYIDGIVKPEFYLAQAKLTAHGNCKKCCYNKKCNKECKVTYEEYLKANIEIAKELGLI